MSEVFRLKRFKIQIVASLRTPGPDHMDLTNTFVMSFFARFQGEGDVMC